MSKKVILIVVMPMALFVTGLYRARVPRAWSTGSVPVAFWAWRNNAPDQQDVDRASNVTGSQILFVHAGQLDSSHGAVTRIRPIAGHIPSGIEIHLVYNATRNVLDNWEHVDLDATAGAVVDAFTNDTARAIADHAQIGGIQLDLDIPDRLLGRYKEFLHLVRVRTPPGINVSITGLASWTNSKDLPALLSETDFWLPQFYGYNLAMRADERVPIGPVEDVAAVIDRVRELNKPYYAGLASFAYALLYGKSGDLIELRGDIGANAIIESRLFELRSRDQLSGETRCEFLAIKDGVLDGLTIEAGDLLVFQVPTAESLAAAATLVRERGGEDLHGICVFRLPTTNDEAALTLEEVQSALLDVPTRPAVDLAIRSNKGSITVIATERGSARSVIGRQVTVDVEVPPGIISNSDVQDGSYSTLCGGFEAAAVCSPRRANLLRFNIDSLSPGADVRITLPNTELPSRLPARVLFQTDDGRIEAEFVNILVHRSEE